MQPPVAHPFADARRARAVAGFTLVELLVVIGIIALLISMLLPALSKARAQANKVACQSNLRVIGQMLVIYADEHSGFLFPGNMGWDKQHVQPFDVIEAYQQSGQDLSDPLPTSWTFEVWPSRVFQGGKWNPPIMVCPNDVNCWARHSYVINEHMAEYNIKFGTRLPNGQSPSDIVLMGEKVTQIYDYYMENGVDPKTGKFSDDFFRVVEKYRHGIQLGSNYLKLDFHVDTLPPDIAQNSVDPWDIAGGTATTQPSN